MKLKKIMKQCRLMINKIGSKRRNKRLKSFDFSIISNNCFAGIIYQYLGLKYNTPTIGLYFYPDEYIKFLKKFDYYIEKELKFIKPNQSKYYDKLLTDNNQNAIIGLLDDVEIVFLHYKSEQEAAEKWARRVKRLSKNIIFKFNDQNGCSLQNIEEFNSLPYKNKIVFTSNSYPNINSNIVIKKYKKLKCIKEDYYSCHRYINMIDYINNVVLKKKVLHIIPTYNYSGAENVAISIINYLKDDYDFDYCSFDGNTKIILSKQNINFICLKKFNIFSVRKIIKAGNYDIVHAHDYRASCICRFAFTKAKLISHIHNNNLWIKKLNFNSILYLLSSFGFSSILTVSHSIENEYIFSSAIRSKIVCIGNPVSRNKIILNVTNNDFIKKYDICCVGRITDAKDPLRFANLINEIKKSKKDVKAIWVGDGELKNEFERKIKHLKLTQNIKLVGRKDNPYPYMAQSRIFMLSGKWEGYGLAAYEALSLGLPCVVSNVGGLPEIVDGSCGKLCNSDDDFIKFVIKLLNNEDILKFYSKNAIQKSLKLENIDNYMSVIKKIYNEEE